MNDLLDQICLREQNGKRKDRMQIYRKGILVTYINGEYLVNSDPRAHFVGEGTWDTIYKDSGNEAPEAYCQISLKNGQIGNDGKAKGWY